MFSSSSLKFFPFLLSLSLAASDNVWDYAPDFSKDQYPPYPSLKNPDGNNITIENLRGTHLFGWMGCQTEEVNAISQAYNDFYTLAQQPDVYKSIDWNSKAAVDIWGPSSGPNAVRADTRKEIQQIFAAAQQVYSYPWTWQPWWLSWRQLWIEIRCSDSKEGKDSSDPTNRCGDAKKPPRCGNGQPPVGGDTTLQAFSDPAPDDSRYSRITFCNDFFKLQTFKDAMEAGNKLPAAQKTNLQKWDNRARCFFHEVTHLDYFMNAGDTSDPNDKSPSPYVSDLECQYKTEDQIDWFASYGVYDIKILRNWVDPDPAMSGYFPQRNADSYAFFALAKYVEKQIGKYPHSPSPGRKKPISEPRDSDTKEPPALSTKQGQDIDLIDGDEQDRPDDVQFPGCGDKIPHPTPHDAVVSSISSAYAPGATPTAGPQADPKCDTHALSDIPYNVFDGKAGSVFTNFCKEVIKDEKKKLDWNVDASGNQKTAKRLRFKRTPPPNPKAYDSTFELHWEPASSGSCNTKCDDAYSKMALSPCGHQGGQQNIMAASTSLDVGCGTYSYKVTGKNVPAVEGPPKPFVTAQYCYPSDVFGDHGDIQGYWQSQYTGYACAGSANINMQPGDKRNFNTTTNGVPYNYNIWWKDGCESSVKPMNVYQPLDSNKDANCLDLMQNNYKDCKNGGIGGIISVGCLSYEFKASLGPVGVAS